MCWAADVGHAIVAVVVLSAALALTRIALLVPFRAVRPVSPVEPSRSAAG